MARVDGVHRLTFDAVDLEERADGAAQLLRKGGWRRVGADRGACALELGALSGQEQLL